VSTALHSFRPHLWGANGGESDDVCTARVLIVEDDNRMQATVAGCLRKHGFFNLDKAGDGAAAIELARQWNPELVITDLGLPDFDGFELCRLLRSYPVTASTPILVTTGISDVKQRAEVFEAGASDIVTKPLHWPELLARVRIHIERRRLIERLSELQRRISEDMDQARAMQESLMPACEDIRRLTNAFPIALAGHCLPSIGIGGDLWGVRPVDTGRLLLFNVDFAGHGIGAALNIFRLHSYISSGLGHIESPSQCLTDLNRYLCGMLPTGQYATAFCAIIDFNTAMLRHASAASPANLILSAERDDGFQPIDGTGFPLGVIREAHYEDHSVSFGPGSKVFLFSDALIETPDPANPVFAVDDLCRILDARKQDARPELEIDALLTAFQAVSPDKPDDDLTLVMLHHRRSQ